MLGIGLVDVAVFALSFIAAATQAYQVAPRRVVLIPGPPAED